MVDQTTLGQQMMAWAKELFPINRSLTGKGVRETLSYIKGRIPTLNTYNIASKEQVFDWQVPKEWSIEQAYIITPDGEKICDFAINNLHLVGYSIPIQKTLTLEELRPHLYSLPNQPDAIPYITSYYQENWGFCLSHHDYIKLKEGNYQVVIKSQLFDGQLDYADLVIKGKSEKEVLLSTYICHPSMANNELSGPLVAIALAQWLERHQSTLKYSYRIVFAPETIGSICYLARNLTDMKTNTVAGFQMSCVGDDNEYSHVASRYGNTLSDRVVQEVLADSLITEGKPVKHYSFLARGSDERQYCAPLIDLPICGVCRTKYGEYKEYHTSEDNLDFISEEGLLGSIRMLQACITKIEQSQYPLIKTLGEPQLGKRGLYPNLSQHTSHMHVEDMMNCIAYADGKNRFEDIAQITGVDIESVKEVFAKLANHQLIEILEFPTS